MTINEILQHDAEDIFFHSNALGVEQITYTPRGGIARLIYAQVTRTELGPARETTELRDPAFTIEVANHATRGVLSSATDTIGGKFVVATRFGHAVTKDLVIRQESLAAHDAGAMRFEF